MRFLFSALSSMLFVIVAVHSLPTGFAPNINLSQLESLPVVEFSAQDDVPLIFADSEGSFFNVETDGIAVEKSKKKEKMPMEKKFLRDLPSLSDKDIIQPKTAFFSKDFSAPVAEADVMEPQPGVAPKLTEDAAKALASTEAPEDYENFHFGEGEAAAETNPAATQLEGGDFEKIDPPTCRMLGCTGPLPNDGSVSIPIVEYDSTQCTQTFVPMNGCTDNKGYPMGMVCTICCDCTTDFVSEMKKTVGYKNNFTSN